MLTRGGLRTVRCALVALVCLLAVGVAATGGAAASSVDGTDWQKGATAGAQISTTGLAGAANNSTAQSGYAGRDESSAATAEPIRERVTVDRTPAEPGAVTVTYEVTAPARVVSVQPVISGIEAAYAVESASGFRYDDGAGQWTLDSARGTETSGTITYTVAANATAFGGYETVETAEWAFLDSRQFPGGVYYRYFGSAPDVVSSYETVGPGYGANGFVFLGSHGTVRQAGDDQTITVVAPDAANARLSASATADLLANVSGRFEIGDRDPTVTAFLAPDPIRSGGRGGGSAFWVGAGTYRSTVTTLHEYVHTRQGWTDADVYPGTLASDVEWFTEASADYYGGYLAWRAGGLSDESFQEYLSTETASYSDAVLQDPDTDSSERKNYYKGRRVLAALDIAIRNHTDGNETLETVLRRFNSLAVESPGYADLRREVVAATNESTGRWLDRYVRTTAAPEIPSDIASAYAVDPDPVAVRNLSVAPTAVEGNGTVTHDLAVTLDGVSGDGAAETVTVSVGSNASVTDIEGLTVTDASGAEVPVTSGPTVLNASDGRTGGVRFSVSPRRDGTLSIDAVVAVTYPSVDERTAAELVVEVTDSARGSDRSNATLTVEPATPESLVVSLSPETVAANASTNVTVSVTTASGAPVVGATVSIPGLPSVDQVQTNETGIAAIEVDADTAEYAVAVSADGYVGANGTLTAANASAGPDVTGVSSELAAAVAGEDGSISADDIRAAVRGYFRSESVGGVPIAALDVRAIVRHYFRT